jgi:hypothetical protein
MFFVAGIGPVSMMTGSTPPSANAWKRARGRRPRSRAALLHHEHRRGAVGELARVAGGDDAVVLEGGLQAHELRERAVGPDAFVGGDDVAAAVGAAHLDGYDLVLEPAVPGRGGGLLLRADRELVERLARELPLLRDDLRRDALLHEPADAIQVLLDVASHHRRPEGLAADADTRAHRHPAHRLDAGGDDDVVGARDHALRGEVQRLLARPTLPIDRRPADGLGKAGGERGVTADVQALLADLAHASHDHVLDDGGIDARLLDEGAERLRGEVDGVDGIERSGLLASPERGPHGFDDHGFTHDISFAGEGAEELSASSLCCMRQVGSTALLRSCLRRTRTSRTSSATTLPW